MGLDAASLEAITQEIRTCFLYEDAPDHLTILEAGIGKLRASARSSNLQTEYNDLMRAAHSLKGGAGIAQLLTVSKLAHNLEDLLQALHQGRVQDREFAYELLSLSVEQISSFIATSTSSKEDLVAVVAEASLLPIINTLHDFIEKLSNNSSISNFDPENYVQDSSVNPNFLKTLIEVDLEEYLQRVERLLQSPTKKILVQPSAALHQALTALMQECMELGQALDLTQLSDTASSMRQALAQANTPIEKIAETAVIQIRQLRLQILSTTLEEQSAPATSAQFIQPSQVSPSLNLRIPISRLDRMNNAIGELLIGYERLSLYQEQLHQVNLTLKKRAAQLDPINEQVQTFYDWLATPLGSFTLNSASGIGLSVNPQHPLSTDLSTNEFEPLEFDRYAKLHTTLQDFQELMVQMQEARADVELISSEFREALATVKQQLTSLYCDLTESRLVPFRFLVEQFEAVQQTFSQRYNKPVELVIIGKETLIDQVILEQLKISLTHLFRNAFDHGIETSEERLAVDKSTTARIILSATVQSNQIAIAIEDDGRGIELKKVHGRAVQMGLCSSIDELTREQILEFLFTPGFSTAANITDISGRGVGLDIVRLQVERLRGSVSVESRLGQGTKFTINIPLTLSILSLLLCRCQQQTLAIPSTKIIEIFALSEFSDSITQAGEIIWRDRLLPLYPLMQLLPYSGQAVSPSSQSSQRLGIVIEVDNDTVVVAVDSLLGERELVLKFFDKTVKVPAYVSGCTVLGTGEVVPVLSPEHFGELIAANKGISRSNKESGLKPDSDGTSRILIVDDSITFRRLLDDILNKSGYQVVQCRDGKEALDKLNQSGELFDLVISDVEMPRLDGFALLREIRYHRYWQLPVMMLTSRENDRYRQKAMSLGATAYFTKPFRPNELLSAIAALLA